jgi:glutamate racemase
MIGVFDSGIGGLSVVREIVRLLPCEDLLYVADSAHCPYGDKSAAEVLTLSRGIVRFLMDKHCNIVVVACNTASAAAAEHLRNEYPDFPFVALEPAVKPAVKQTQTKHIGVVATAGTFKGQLFRQTTVQHANDVEIHTAVGVGWVELVEQLRENTPEAAEAVRRVLQPLIDARIDCLVLGCTHYSFLRATIENITQGKVSIIDSAAPVALQTRRLLKQRGLLQKQKRRPSYCFYTTGKVEVLQQRIDAGFGA